MKILLVRENIKFSQRPNLSIGMAQIAALIRNRTALQVKVIDNNSIYRHYNTKQMVHLIAQEQPDLIGMNVTLFGAYSTYRLIAALRSASANTVIIGGGIHANHGAREMLDHGFNLVFRGEADVSMTQFLKQVSSADRLHDRIRGGDFEDIRGLVYEDRHGEVIDTGFPDTIKDLDSLPYPDFSQFNLRDYIRTRYDHHGVSNIINGQRGCPFTCDFCHDLTADRRVRSNSAKYLHDLLLRMVKFCDLNHVYFYDNNFTLSKSRLADFCERMISLHRREPSRITWSCQTNSKVALDEDLIRMMSQAGCTSIGLGVERLSEEGLKLIGKPQRIDTILHNIRLLRENNITPFVNGLYGFSFDTLELLSKERHMLDELVKQRIMFNINCVLPVPGTKIYDPANVKHSGWYLKEGIMQRRPSYYELVYNYMNPASEVNFFNIDNRVMHEIIRMKEEYYRRNVFRMNNWLWSAIMVIEMWVARVSQYLGHRSRRLEDMTFGMLKKLRFFVGNRVLLRTLYKEGKAGRSQDLESTPPTRKRAWFFEAVLLRFSPKKMRD